MASSETIERVRRLAEVFSAALVDVVAGDSSLEFEFGRFPKGDCKLSSRLFGKVLIEDGIVPKYVIGSKSSGEHGWLELEGCIIDLTSCQFDDGPACPYVSDDGKWHSEWTENEPIDLREWPLGRYTEFVSRIVARMNELDSSLKIEA